MTDAFSVMLLTPGPRSSINAVLLCVVISITGDGTEERPPLHCCGDHFLCNDVIILGRSDKCETALSFEMRVSLLMRRRLYIVTILWLVNAGWKMLVQCCTKCINAGVLYGWHRGLAPEWRRPPCVRISAVEMGRSRDRLILVVGISMPEISRLYAETTPGLTV